MRSTGRKKKPFALRRKISVSVSPSKNPARPHLELSGVVLVPGALPALPQSDEGETSKISRAGCQQDHCEGEEREQALKKKTTLEINRRSKVEVVVRSLSLNINANK